MTSAHKGRLRKPKHMQHSVALPSLETLTAAHQTLHQRLEQVIAICSALETTEQGTKSH
ncbi:MAG: hypothetical protein AAFW84_33155 [Cyanobacteria bacterium J06635_15]